MTAHRHDPALAFIGLLAFVFAVLRILGAIDTSWWLVLAPMWVPPVCYGAGLLVGLAWVRHSKRSGVR